jgi:hypothetical protein
VQNLSIPEIAARLGFAARGLLYMAIGYLALRLGRGQGGESPLAFIESAGGGVVLGVMALGFAAYGIWRLADAVWNTEGHAADAKGTATRLGSAISGLVHLALAFTAVRLATGSGGGGSTGAAEQGASAALSFPGGSIALMIVAVALLATGLFQIVKAVKLGFLRHLDQRVAGQQWVKWIGRAGYLARGTVFMVLAWFAWRAGQQSSSTAAGGTEQAMDALPEWLRLLVAAGFVLFGIFSFVEARYRRINDPGVMQRLRGAIR